MRGIRIKFFAVVAATALVLSCGGISTDNTNVSDPKILGGSTVSSSQDDNRFRSTVALTTDYAPEGGSALMDQGHSFCTGTIVSETVVVTAAHCLRNFDRQDRTVLPGLSFPKAENFIVHFDVQVDEDGRYAAAEKVIPHPDWNPATTLSADPATPPNDIGVIILSDPIPEGKVPAVIAADSVELETQQDIHLVGYGITSTSYWNNTGTMRQVVTQLKNLEEQGHRMKVAGRFWGGACAGDSGGPAYIDVDGEYQVVGALSTGTQMMGTCMSNYNIHTDVRKYRDWIDSVTQ